MFDSQGFAKAAKAMGYSDEEIQAVASMAQNTPPSVDQQQKQINLQRTQNDLNKELGNTNYYNDLAGKGLISREDAIKNGVNSNVVGNLPTAADLKAKQETLKNLKEKGTFYYDNVRNAQNILDLMNLRKQGKIDEKTYESRKKILASEQAAHVGFGIGGKVLSEGEKAILQPMMANIAKSKTVEKGNVFQRSMGWLLGKPVPEVEKSQEVLNETDDSLRSKMESIINTYGDDQVKKKYIKAVGNQGQTNGQPLPTIDNSQFHGNPIENAANEVVSGVKGAISYLTTPHPNQTLDITNFKKDNPVKTAAGMVGGYAGAISKTAGFGVKPDGSISWSPVDIAKHVWNQPIETLSVLAPLKGKMKVPTKGELPPITVSGQKAIESAMEFKTGGGTKKLIANNVLKDQAQSLNQTLLDHNIYKYTDKGRIEATQKALIDEGLALDGKYVKSKFTIGSEIVDQQVNTILAQNGITDPAVSAQIKDSLKTSGVYNIGTNASQYSAHDLWEMAKRGDKFGPKAYNIPSIGPQAKAVSKDLSRYFRGVLAEKVPEATPNLRSYANLKTYMEDVLPDPVGMHAKGAMSIMNVMANIANTAMGRPMDVVAQKTYNALNKLAPEQTAATSATMEQTLPEITTSQTAKGIKRKPLETLPQIVTSIENKKPAQASRLLRDNRYKDWTERGTRSQQEKMLRSSTKKKYR